MAHRRQDRESKADVGWTVRGRLEADAGSDVELVVDAQSDATVHVDPAGRSWFAGSRVPVRRMRIVPVQGHDPLSARLLAAAVHATPRADESPRLLRTLLELMGPARTFERLPSSRVVEVSLAPEWGHTLSRAGETNVPSDPHPRGSGIWRAPADDAALLDGGVIALLRNGTVLVLNEDESRLWQEACGLNHEELAEQVGLPASAVHQIVRGMESGGTLAAEPSWYIRDATARALSADGLNRYLVPVDRSSPPLAIDSSGATIWQVLEDFDRPATTSAIVAHIREQHGVEEDISADVLAFLGSLVAAGVVAC